MKIGISVLVIIIVLGLGYYLLTRTDASLDTDTPASMEEDDNAMESDSDATGNTGSSVTEEQSILIGTYKADRDDDFIADFVADGTVRFHNDAGSGTIENGTWYVLTDAQVQNAEFAVPDETLVGKMVVAISFDDTTYYTVEQEDAMTLVLDEIDGSEGFVFTRLEA